MKITASVVLYNTPYAQFKELLFSVIHSETVTKFYVIDNSPKKNPELYEKWDIVEYIPHENTGYGSSHNIAMRKAIEECSTYHIVLNPDISFGLDVLDKLSTYMERHNEIVYIMPKIVYPNGDLQYLCKKLPSPSDLIFRRFIPSFGFLKKLKQKKDDEYTLRRYFNYEKIINPPCLSGCFMFMRVDALKKNNIFFDEKYFMYFEDFDIIRQLHKIGKTVYFPEVSAIHDHAKISYKNFKMMFIHIKSAFRYFNKYGWFFDIERKKMNNCILNELKNL